MEETFEFGSKFHLLNGPRQSGRTKFVKLKGIGENCSEVDINKLDNYIYFEVDLHTR